MNQENKVNYTLCIILVSLCGEYVQNISNIVNKRNMNEWTELINSKDVFNSLAGSSVAHEDSNNSHNEEVDVEELCIRKISISLKI